ncbi:MAG TPA: cytochrome c [Gemmatimonadaceae bacterium]|nr:cytochrome c [Gemmatimonadaceae bacterium]
MPRLRFVMPLAILPMAAALAASHSRSPHSTTRTVWDSVYTMNQAARGETAYARSCARCHGASLSGGDQSPPLSGGAFLGNWNGTPLSDLQTRILTTMPSDSIGIYKRELVTDVIAYLLKSNGFPAGAAELSPLPDSLKDITLRTSR